MYHSLSDNSIPVMDEKKKVFISYAREDFETARRLYDDLKRAGVSPWMDKTDLLGGQRWQEIIRNAIKDSSCFLALISENSVSKKGFAQKELKFAIDELGNYPPDEIYIIPVRLDKSEPKHYELKELQWIDIFPSYKSGLKKILRVLFSDEHEEQDSKIRQSKQKKRDIYKSDQERKSKKGLTITVALIILFGAFYLLIPEKYSLTVNPVPNDAEVHIIEPYNDYYPGVRLKPGLYKIEVALSGFEADRRFIEITDKFHVEKVVLEPLPKLLELGKLFIVSIPADASIKLSNSEKPYSAGMELNVGLHEIEVSKEGYQSFKKYVKIEVGKKTEVKVILGKIHSDQSKDKVIITSFETSGDIDRYFQTLNMKLNDVFRKGSHFNVEDASVNNSLYDFTDISGNFEFSDNIKYIAVPQASSAGNSIIMSLSLYDIKKSQFIRSVKAECEFTNIGDILLIVPVLYVWLTGEDNAKNHPDEYSAELGSCIRTVGALSEYIELSKLKYQSAYIKQMIESHLGLYKTYMELLTEKKHIEKRSGNQKELENLMLRLNFLIPQKPQEFGPRFSSDAHPYHKKLYECESATRILNTTFPFSCKSVP